MTENIEQNSKRSRPSLIAAYLELTKPRIATLVLVTTALGFFLAGQGQPLSLALLGFTLLGTALTGGGASALNQYLEREVDAHMNRTCNRPLPAGVIAAQSALLFGVLLVLCGCFILLWKVNLLAAFLALLSTFLYVLVYTPMKRISWLNTSIGAIPGAMPPLIGCAAAAERLDPVAWILFFVLFIWQHPHFYAIAWMFRDEYRHAGFKMLPVVKPDGTALFRQSLGFSILLIPVSILPSIIGNAGPAYFIGALLAGLAMLSTAIIFARTRSHTAARLVLHTSIVYLPVLFMLILADRVL